MKSENKLRKLRRIEAKSIRLLHDPRFIYMAGHKIGELGVVGEKRNPLVLLLAGIARTLPRPPSILVKGPPSSGKSTLVKTAVRLFPPDCVLERAGLSGKALAHGKGSFAHKILFITEYRCGKDAQQLLRLLQSEGRIAHEYTTVLGARRGTNTVERTGSPVVLTTTTDEKVFPDDEARFLPIFVDDSATQNLAIVLASAQGPRIINDEDLPLWQMAMSRLKYRNGDFEHPPAWLQYVAKKLPHRNVRVRRDWERFLSFCDAVALWRGVGSNDPVDITFSDYCIAYRIFEPVFAAALHDLPAQEVALGRAVAKLTRRLKRPVTVREIADELNWKDSRVYKHAKGAVRHKLLQYEPGAREKNIKGLLPCDHPNSPGCK